MTKFMNKSFSVGMYANHNEACALCGQEAKVYYLTPERLCPQCYEIKKQEKAVKKLQEAIKPL